MHDLGSFYFKIQKGTPTMSTLPDEDLKKELERLKAENAALKKTTSRGLSLKVSAKGALSVYGMGRFPVTLYKEQWLKLLDLADDLRSFIAANDAQLKAKGQDDKDSKEEKEES